MNIRQSFPLTEEILEHYRDTIGKDYTGYRNHVTRVLNFCRMLYPQMDETLDRKLQIAAAFHDIGLWTDDRVDYLDPSVAVCMEYLGANGLTKWCDELSIIIDMHHYVSKYKGKYQTSVELFRRADLVDFSLGFIRSGLGRKQVKAVRAAIPNAGFHINLMRFTFRQLLSNPLDPLPMVRFNDHINSSKPKR